MERIFRPDDRPTPAADHPDGVDFVPMKTWRVFLVQLLNIAGTVLFLARSWARFSDR